uniref:Seryl_tRNA_N domain-containing protein n=1 Tax=Caenorhabditis tropicalis TaxID=1561998 RepID=A0A1I7TDD3_9PELO
MVLDIDLFRVEKGGNPEIIRKSQRDRYKDVKLVDEVIEWDEKWRKERFVADQLNRQKNAISKAIGEKMKKKEPQGTDDTVSDDIVARLADLKLDELSQLTVVQLKKLRLVLDEKSVQTAAAVVAHENARHEKLVQIGNLLHESVVVSDNEDNNKVERTFGDLTTVKKYSHVDLVVMVDGFDGERGTVVAGGRGYF